jgi:hypothetical protein
MDPIFAKFTEYGLVGLVIAVLFFIVWKILVWVMAWVDKQAVQQAAERDGWLCQLKAQSEVLQKISASIDEHDKRADERGRYVREEHKEMISSLGRINGYKHEGSA